jgi:hypothetical protein
MNPEIPPAGSSPMSSAGKSSFYVERILALTRKNKIAVALALAGFLALITPLFPLSHNILGGTTSIGAGGAILCIIWGGFLGFLAFARFRNVVAGTTALMSTVMTFLAVIAALVFIVVAAIGHGLGVTRPAAGFWVAMFSNFISVGAFLSLVVHNAQVASIAKKAMGA